MKDDFDGKIIKKNCWIKNKNIYLTDYKNESKEAKKVKKKKIKNV